MSKIACSSADPGSKSVMLIGSQKAFGRTGLHTFGFGSALHSIYKRVKLTKELKWCQTERFFAYLFSVSGIFAKAVRGLA